MAEDPTLAATGAGAPSAARELSPGHIISGRYAVQRRLGAGGMGVVYEATHLMLGTSVAVKVLRPELLECRDHVLRFTAESRCLARLPGEHVVRVFDAGRMDAGVPYFAMERLGGGSLAERLRQRGALGSRAAVQYALAICRGLADVHAAGIVHRDIKPANVVFGSAAGHPLQHETLKIIDFGIALRRGEAASDEPLEHGIVLGSPSYAAPEQLVDSTAVDESADLWSLGVVLLEMLAGRLPMERSSSAEEFRAGAARSLRAASGIDPRLIAIVEKCLEPDPCKRFSETGELWAALSPLAAGDRVSIAPRLGTTLRVPPPAIAALKARAASWRVAAAAP